MPADAAVVESHHRLVVQLELARSRLRAAARRAARAARGRARASPPRRRGSHPCRRACRCTSRRRRCGSVRRRRARSPSRGARRCRCWPTEVLAGDRDRHLEPGTRRSATRRGSRGRDVLDQDGELVAAEARSGVGRRGHGLQAGGDLPQHLVAGGWPRLSLIVLKSSRSRKMTAMLVPSRAARVSACSTRSEKARGWAGRSRRRGTPGAPAAPRTLPARSRPGR